MWKWIILTIMIMPALELAVILWAGSMVGGWSVFGFILLTGFIGAVLAKQQGAETLQQANERMQRSEMPGEQIFDGICILIGGLLLLTPGFITDAIGFSLLLPFTRGPLKQLLKRQIEQMVRNGQVITYRRF
ncbi:MAG: FxsA family protein [Bacillota bacterium]